VMRLRLGLQLASVAATMGSGDPFVPTNLDFIDWEARGAQFVAVNGRSAERIRREYHGLFETGLLDPFKNGSCLFFAGVTFATCFTPAVARDFNKPVDNAGFVVGDHFPDGLQGRGLPYINTELGFLEGQRNDHCAGVYLNERVTELAEIYLGVGAATSGAVNVWSNSSSNMLSRSSSSSSFSESSAITAPRALFINRSVSSQYTNYGMTDTVVSGSSQPIDTDAIRIFDRTVSSVPARSRLTAGFFGDAHPNPTDLRTALNDLFITKMGITI
jgi:hypothetical protein